MAAFDKYSKEVHEMTAEHAGPRAATATFWLTLLAYWCGGLTIIIGAIFLASKFLFPYVSAVTRLSLPQAGNAALSLAIAIAVVGVAVAWLLKTFRRTRETLEGAFATRLDAMNVEIQSVSGRIGDVAGPYRASAHRVHYLESHAASLNEVNEPSMRYTSG